MLINISEKVVVITGSSKGIGCEIAKAFAKENAKVVLNYLNSEKEAIEIYDEIRKYNSNCLLIKADVTKPKEVANLYRLTIEEFGKVDILINNAGKCDDNLINMMSFEQWDKVLNVNLNGTFLCCREFSKTMIKQKSGKIFNIASLKGIEGTAGQVNYSASKAGVIGLTKALAKELGQYNISVNAVCPGFIVTDLNRHDLSKKEIAKKRSVLSCEHTLNDLIKFIIHFSSDNILGISGQVFILDSRIN